MRALLRIALLAGFVACQAGNDTAPVDAPGSAQAGPSHGFLGPVPSVTHDTTLTGKGTPASPLSVIGAAGSGSATFSAITDTGPLGVSGTSTLGGVTATSLSDSGPLILTGSIAPTALAGSVNNYAPCDVTTPANCLATTNLVRQDASVASTVTGLAAQASGQAVALLNISATNNITLTNEDTNSTAPNRFTLPNGASWVIPPGGAVLLRYSSATSRWRPEHSNNNNVMATALANSGPETETGFINPTGLTGTISDWAPTGFANAKYIYATASSSATLTGIAGGADGRAITIFVDPTGATVAINNENASSLAANRIQLPGSASWTLGGGGIYALTLRYNGAVSRWQMVSGTSFQDNSVRTFASTFNWAANVNPATLASGVTNDWTPGATTELRTTPASGGSTVTSLLSGAGQNGRITTITNIATADNLTLTHDDGASGTAANRFLFDNLASCVLTPNTSITLRYDSTSSRWRLITPCPNSTQNLFLGTQTDSFTTQQDNYALSVSATRLVWTGSTAVTVTGMAGGADGRILIVENQSAGGNTLSLSNENASSTAANRISDEGNTTLALSGLGSNAVFVYDGAASRWRLLGYSSQQINAAKTFVSSVAFSGTLSPPALTGGTVNDYAPTGSSVAFQLRQDVNTADTTLTGLSVANGSGKIITLTNISSAFKIILHSDDGASSTATNRFVLDNGVDCVLPPSHNITLRYDNTSARWRPIDGCPHSTQAGYPGATITTTDTGTVNDYNPTGLANATILRLNNASALTITGIAGGTDGRQLIICNQPPAASITLANESASSAAANRITNLGNVNSTLSSSAGSTCSVLLYDSAGSRWRAISATNVTYGYVFGLSSTLNRGTITLSGGTGSATTFSGAVCTCTDTTATAAVKCNVSSTTLTATGTTTDVIAYHCF